MFLKKLKILEELKLIFTFDREGTLYFINSYGQRLFNLKPENFSYKKHFYELLDDNSIKPVEESIKQLSKSKKNVQLKVVFKINETHKFDSLLNISLLNDKNDACFGYIAEADIDENELLNYLRHFNDTCHEFLDNIPIGIYRTRIDGQIIFANKGLLNIFGYNELSEIKNVSDIFADKNYRTEKIKKWIEQKKYNDEFELITKEGKTIFVKDEGHVVFENGEPMYFDGALENITEKKKMEKRLNELNVSKNKFFSILSHDLKGAFGQFIGATDLILDEINNFDKEQIENIVKLLNEQAERNYKLLENLLDWSKSQEGILKFQPEPINLAVLVNEIVEYYKQSAKKKSIDLHSNIKKNLIIYADKYMLSTVLRNLVSNALKFTHKNGTVVISAKEVIDKKNHGDKILEISVADTGVGIEKEQLNNIFNLERNFSTKGTEDEMGTGLGLILCKEFVEKHGGKIWVESEEGKGSVFKFIIP